MSETTFIILCALAAFVGAVVLLSLDGYFDDEDLYGKKWWEKLDDE